jgi:hypothetical protein
MWKSASALAVLGALTCASVALAGGGPSEHPSAPRTITVAGKTVQLNLVDAGEPGFTLGDQVALSDDLRAGDKLAGFDGGVCTLVRIADAEAQSGTRSAS